MFWSYSKHVRRKSTVYRYAAREFWMQVMHKVRSGCEASCAAPSREVVVVADADSEVGDVSADRAAGTGGGGGGGGG
jgi:hypothetical protein